ncbi:MAG: thiolase family protein [Alphaproteobacteria bacterium]|nr:thiolase family protein [Alphaproteobacteria bacterium]
MNTLAPNPALRDACAIVGTGTSRLGKVPGVSALALIEEAVHNALIDAGLKAADVDGLIVRGPDDVYTFHQVLGERLGIDAAFSTTTANGGASQILSVILAVMAIEAGLASTVVCGYGRDAWSRTHASKDVQMRGATRAAQMESGEFGPEYGLFGAAAMHGFGARRHMFEFGTTREQFGAISLAFRAHANRNPAAQMHGRPLTMDDYLDARMIVEPFCLLDCSLRSDAAGAVIVTSAERARDLKQKPVLVKGFATHNNTTGWFAGDNMIRTAAGPSSARAYAMAGLGPGDIDCAQIYDCFTYMVLTQLEDYGFCAKGEGGDFVASGALALDGALPTNTSGGQLSEAHAEGMLQVVEGARQLQGIYDGERQVPGAETCIVSGHGGNTVCHSTLILGTAT